MTTTKEIGDLLEDDILSELESDFKNLTIRKSKGSGNQRGDGDIKIISHDQFKTPLLFIDGKNSHSSNGTVPSKKDVDKHHKEAINHASIYGGVVVRRGTDGKTYAACEWETMLALVRAMLQHEENYVRK